MEKEFCCSVSQPQTPPLGVRSHRIPWTRKKPNSNICIPKGANCPNIQVGRVEDRKIGEIHEIEQIDFLHQERRQCEANGGQRTEARGQRVE